jgi:pyruvate/2-oxoglutarate dehydrogenase complex dihydrolipoamide acyltransferase (E2) component
VATRGKGALTFRSSNAAAVRRLTRDFSSFGRNRNLMRGFIEVDVTDTRRLLREHRARSGESISLTAYLVSCLATAASEHPEVHAVLDWRGRVCIPERADIAVLVEADSPDGPVPLAMVIRDAQARSPGEIDAEIRAGKRRGGDNGPAARVAARIPGPLRRLGMRLFMLDPKNGGRLGGTIAVTAVGMFTRRGGWGTGLPIHPLTVTIGGLARKPGLVGDEVLPREFLSLTLEVDHDVVDGAPAARFTERFCRLLESGANLPSETAE